MRFVVEREAELESQIQVLKDELDSIRGDVWIAKTEQAQHKFWMIEDTVCATLEKLEKHSLRWLRLKHGSYQIERSAVHWPSFGDIAKEISKAEFARVVTLYLDRAEMYLNKSRDEARQLLEGKE